jgi:hypothetical protein
VFVYEVVVCSDFVFLLEIMQVRWETVQQVFRENEDNYTQKQSRKTSRLKERVTELKAGPHFVLPLGRAAEGKLLKMRHQLYELHLCNSETSATKQLTVRPCHIVAVLRGRGID